MPKGMVITVGVGRGIESAIVLSIRNANPNIVIFLVTEESEQNTLPRIKQFAQNQNISLPTFELKRVDNENDADSAYQAAVQAIRQLKDKGISPANITVDYTTGTKPMSAGALYAAVMEGCDSVVYVAGQRDSNGRVIAGTEQFLSYHPNRLLARRILAEAVSLFNVWQFGAAKQLLDNFLKAFPEEHIPQLFPDLHGLRLLCAAYQAWDAFDHSAAQQAFEKVNKSIIDRWSPQIACNKGWVNRLANKLKSQNLGDRLCEELLVDLWANAQRRLQEQRFVDAVARLYRLTELIAQFRLWHQHEIDTSDVDISKVPKQIKPLIKQYRHPQKKKIQLPLRAAYELLAELGDEIGRQGIQSGLQDALSKRNASIAAHGLEPVSEETAVRLREAVKPLLRNLVPSLNKLLEEKVLFPQLAP